MYEHNEFKPAIIGEKCKQELSHLEAQLSDHNSKDIILVAYEKK